MQRKYTPDVDEPHLGVTLSFDYCFMTPDEFEDDMHAILVIYDHIYPNIDDRLHVSFDIE